MTPFRSTSRSRSGVSAHDHEWEPADTASLLFEEAEAVFLQDCEYVEILSSTHCERRDETYHEYGPSCEATRQYRLGVSRLEPADGPTREFECIEAVPEPARETIARIERAATSGNADVTIVDPGVEPERVEVQYEGCLVVYSRQESPE